MPARWTRRELLTAALRGGAGLLALGGAGLAGYRWPHPGQPPAPATPDRSEGVDTFVSRPDLRPPQVTVYLNRQRSPRPRAHVVLAPRGYSLSAPGQQGVMLLGIDGHPRWFRATAGTPMDLRVQSWRGQPVLTWWEGEVVNGYGKGTGQVVDQTYRQVATIRAGNGVDADLHELLLTAHGTALITAYDTVSTTLSAAGGPARGDVLDGVVQEVDVATGRVLFDWRSLDHVGIDETYAPPPGSSPTVPYDYFHVNSIDVAPDGDLLVCARNTWAVYKVSRTTGAIVWRLGGRRSSFTFGEGARFYWQHDARALGPGAIALFDDGASPAEEQQSRGMVLELDTIRMTARLARQYTHPAGLLAPNQGSMQVLSGGGAFVGWGAQPYFSEFGPDGALVLDGRLPNNVQSYRAYLQEWVGMPAEAPTMVVRPSAVGGSTIYTSWNGATELAEWAILAGPGPGSLQMVARSHRTGFETTTAVASKGPYFMVVALDRAGRELGRSQVIRA